MTLDIPLKDEQQRLLATDPTRSFIVQAPAGAGKTELLTQRYLRLLAKVKQPEEIIALTFTRKAAHEMRQRILLALEKAQCKILPPSTHQQLTFKYAQEALKHAENLNWDLLANPHRLKIFTIDSLCQRITQARPTQAKELALLKIAAYPKRLYQRAARECFAYAIEEKHLQTEIKLILNHLDNRQDLLIELFTQLLAQRTPWLHHLYAAREQTRSEYETALKLIEQEEITLFKQTLTLEEQTEICQLCASMANLENNPQSSRYHLINWTNFSTLNREIGQGLADMLLTATHQLRKSFDHHIGLKKGCCEPAQYEYLKNASKALLEKLSFKQNFVDRLVLLKHLPPPHYTADEWLILQAILTLLPFLAAHLSLVFQAAQEVDFSQVTEQALSTLGSDEQPKDLALYWDAQISHLLVDEFQDTSVQQFSLLTKLVQNWDPPWPERSFAQKTLFLVGDPMQSIYRFRQAEVGLFLRAQQEGIGPIKLELLRLHTNFRSTDEIITWVNGHLGRGFPQQEDICKGAIPYSPFTAKKRNKEDEPYNNNTNHSDYCNNNIAIQALLAPNKKQAAAELIQLLQTELNREPQDQIAILVRSRTHLSEIITLLRQENIPFRGVDIAPLTQLAHVNDLWTLTQALHRPADRLSWLCLLRSPFCGLTLADLHAIANYDQKRGIFANLNHLEKIQLSKDGCLRAQFFYQIMKQALESRQQLTLVDWVLYAFNALQGPLVYTAAQLKDLEPLWVLLENFQTDNFLSDFNLLSEEFKKLYAQAKEIGRVHIMTIHKAKGLEFDTVILPELGSPSLNRDNPLVRWLQLPSKQQNLIIASPLKALHQEKNALYTYLQKIEDEKDHFELQRLLYVAVTRAKKRLYLIDSQEEACKHSFRSFISHYPFRNSTVPKQNNGEDAHGFELENQAIKKPPLLYRLATTFYPPPSVTQPPLDSYSSSISLILPSPLNLQAKHLGIICHDLIRWLCEFHPRSYDQIPWQWVNLACRQLGYTPNEQKLLIAQVKMQIENLFKSKIGTWLIKKHEQEENEISLLCEQQGLLQTKIIDRTFVEHGQRWVIDFKTGKEEDNAQLHHQQVNAYAALLIKLYPEPINCGLYYLQTDRWVNWKFKENIHPPSLLGLLE